MINLGPWSRRNYVPSIIIAGLLSLSSQTLAAPPPSIANSVAVCDVNAPSHCLKPAEDGSIAVTGGGGGGGDISGLPPTPAPTSPQFISATSSSSNVTLLSSTTTYPAIYLKNSGANLVHYAPGGTATTGGAILNASGGNTCIPAGGVTQVSGITNSSGETAILEVWQLSSCPLGNFGGSGNGVTVGSALGGTVGNDIVTEYENAPRTVTTAAVTLADTVGGTIIWSSSGDGVGGGGVVYNCGTVDVWIGPPGVTVANGIYLPAPQVGTKACNTDPWNYTGELRGITSTGTTQEVRYKRYK